MSTPNNNKIPRPDYANHPAYGKQFQSVSLAQRQQALKRFFPEFRTAYRKTRQMRKLQNAPKPRTTPLYEQLARDGVVPLVVPEPVIDSLRPLIDPHVAAVKAKRDAFAPHERKFEHTNILLKTGENRDPLLSALWNILGDMGIMDAASLYLGKKIRWIGGAVQMNDDTDLHLQHHFDDLGLEDPPTKYMHLDSTIDILKCLLYYTEVTPDTGPFSFVMGSNRFTTSAIEYATRKANDLSRLDRCDPETRAQFWALPSFFQHKSEFGNDLTDPTQMNALLANERHFTSAEGNLIFFDNNAGVHRGALIKSGHRVIVQILIGG